MTFRRTYASWPHDLGVPTKVTAELMGHTKVDVTLSAYTQTLAGAHTAAAECIGDKLQIVRRRGSAEMTDGG